MGRVVLRAVGTAKRSENIHVQEIVEIFIERLVTQENESLLFNDH